MVSGRLWLLDRDWVFDGVGLELEPALLGRAPRLPVDGFCTFDAGTWALVSAWF